MKSVDKAFGSLVKKQKYLLVRILTIFLLVVLGLSGIYSTEKISGTVFYDTLLLFFGPLLVEYFLGMDTYSKNTNRIRWAGLILAGVAVFLCSMGLVGEGKILLNPKTHVFSYTIIFGFIIINAFVIKVYTGIMVGIAVGDFIFTFNKQELELYSLFNKFEELLEEHFEELKQQDPVELKKKLFKSKVLKNLEVQGGK